MDRKAEPEPMDQTLTPNNEGTLQTTRSQPHQTAMDNVFRNDLLRKKILEHVIYSKTTRFNKVNYDDLLNVRFVQKTWLSTVSTLLIERREHLYNFTRDFLLLPSFVEMITHSKRSEQVVPPFSATLPSAFFTPENHEVLEEFLVNCAPGLTSLHLMFPKNCSMPFIFPKYSLSILQQLTIEFASHSHPITAALGRHSNATVTLFIQQLLNSTRELKTLEFRTKSDAADYTVIPSTLELLSIPPTVKALRMKCPFLANHLKMVVPSDNKVNHAHLTELELMASEAPLPGNIIYNILARHSSTLTTLKLSGKDDMSDLIQPSMFQIPAMKNLEKFIVTSPIWNCSDDFHMVSSNFPKLITVQLKKVTVSLFEKLTNPARTRLRFVANLEVSLVNELLPQEHFQSLVTLDREKIQRIHWTFRNVTELDISISGLETSGLKSIFVEMRKLTCLAINVKHHLPNLTCADVDGLMIGAPPGIAQGLWERPDFWESCEISEDAFNYPSVRRLQDLCKLTLASIDSPIFYDFDYGMRGRMLSDVSFHFAFFRMPKLTNLHLYGLFSPSDEMIDLWQTHKVSVGAQHIVHGLQRYPQRGRIG